MITAFWMDSHEKLITNKCPQLIIWNFVIQTNDRQLETQV